LIRQEYSTSIAFEGLWSTAVEDGIVVGDGRAMSVRTDVPNPDACKRLVPTALQHCGCVDVLINNAGVGAVAPVTRDRPRDFRGASASTSAVAS